MHLVDSHAHLDFTALHEDLDGVLSRAAAAGVTTILSIGIGDGPATMHRARDLAAQHQHAVPRVYASVGIHPQEADRADAAALDRLRTLAADPLVLAIGEIGLDYYHVDNPEVPVQQRALRAQMDVAREVRKPILIHLRTSELASAEAKARFGAADATEDFFRIVEEHWAPHGIGGVMHCFSGTAAEARRALDLGFHLSFAGNVTYNRFPGIREAAVLAPADRLLVETDAPFLAPQPLRGQRNEPANTRVTADFVATLRGVSLEELAKATTGNFHKLFALPSAHPTL